MIIICLSALTQQPTKWPDAHLCNAFLLDQLYCLVPPFFLMGTLWSFSAWSIVCPTSRLPKSIDYVISVLGSWGLEVVVGESVEAKYRQFAGEDSLRTTDLQRILDDADTKPIIAGRGGYTFEEATPASLESLGAALLGDNYIWLYASS